MGGVTSRRWLTLRRHDDAVRRRRAVDRLCGVDEAGRGPLAGPVVAAAVVLPPRARLPGLDDSKVLDPLLRSALAERIEAVAVAVGCAFVSPRTIERLNVLGASLLAMRRAVKRLARRAEPDYLLVDGAQPVAGLTWPQEPLIEGDGRSLAVAAASVIAKCRRDRFMVRLDRSFPGYGFARHKGYATPEHLEALRALGPCPWHRFSFAPIRQSEIPFDDGIEEAVVPESLT